MGIIGFESGMKMGEVLSYAAGFALKPEYLDGIGERRDSHGDGNLQ